jgi:hypothetical protein
MTKFIDGCNRTHRHGLNSPVDTRYSLAAGKVRLRSATMFLPAGGTLTATNSRKYRRALGRVTWKRSAGACRYRSGRAEE